MATFTIPRRVWLLAILFVLLTSIPYLVGQFSSPAGGIFSGVIADPLDYYSHLAKMQQGLRGEWLYSILFTSEPHPPILLQTFYVMLGHLARWTGLSLPLVYHIARIFFAVLMVIALYAFARRSLSEQAAWWAVLLACFTGGFGFLVYLIPGYTISPIELWLIDAYILFSAFVFPHFSAAISLLAILMLAVDQWTSEDNRQALIVLTIGGLLMGFLQPFHVAVVGLILLIMTVLRFKIDRVIGLICFGLPAGVAVGYQLAALNSHPVWRAFSDQNVTLSPSPVYFVLGWLPLLVPAIFGAIEAYKRRDQRLILVILWPLLIFPLLYLPINTPRRFSLAMQLPLAVLAVDWFVRVAIPALRKQFWRRWRTAAFTYVIISCLSTIILMLTWVIDATRPNVQFTADRLAGFAWIKANTPTNAVFLSDGTLEDNAAIVGMTGRRVVVGHWAETANFTQKESDWKRFYDPATSDEWRASWLKAQGVNYLWQSASIVPGLWNPGTFACLQPAFTRGTITLYAVTPACS